MQHNEPLPGGMNMFTFFTNFILTAGSKCLLLYFPFLRLFSCSVHVKFATPLSTHADLQHSFLACFKSLLPYYQKYLKIFLFIDTHTQIYNIWKDWFLSFLYFFYLWSLPLCCFSFWKYDFKKIIIYFYKYNDMLF